MTQYRVTSHTTHKEPTERCQPLFKNVLLTLPDTEKFTGSNFSTFKTILETVITGRGLLGYLTRSIPKPADSYTAQSAVTSTTVTAPDGSTRTIQSDGPLTQWNSTNPFVEEWQQ